MTTPDFAEVDRLVNDNLPLAKFFAAKWGNMGDGEALSAVLDGLLQGARTWNAEKGPFGWWASNCIKYALHRSYKRGKAVKRGGRAITLSLDAPVGEDGNASLGDLIADRSADTEVAHDERARLRQLVGALTQRESFIITRRFGLDGDEPGTLEEVGRHLGITRERVRQIEVHILREISLRHGVVRRLPEVETRTPVYGKLGVDPGGFREDAPPARPVPLPKASRDLERARDYIRRWRAANSEYLKFYRRLTRNRLRLWRRQWYRKNRERLTAKQRARYAADERFAAAFKAGARAYNLKNAERVRAKKAEYRASHRQELRDAENQRTQRLVPAYVRQRLASLTGREPGSFTLDEVAAHREHLAARRTELKTRPACPQCGKPGRKDGRFRPSGRPRYSCRHCQMSYGTGAPSAKRGSSRARPERSG